MKKVILLLFVIGISVSMFSQRTAIIDTLDNTTPRYSVAISDPGAISALCTQLGGTSDGTLILEGSTDGTTYVPLVETAGLFRFYPNDTLTVTNGAKWLIIFEAKSQLKSFRVKGTGTANDTTYVGIEWSKFIK